MLSATVEIFKDGEYQDTHILIKNFAHEITIGEWDEMLRIQANAPEFLSDPETDLYNLSAEQSIDLAMHMVKTVSVFCSEGSEGVLQLPAGYNLAQEESDSLSVTLLNCYKLIVHSVDTYEPVPEPEFEHKGRKFFLPVQSVSALNQKEFGNDLKVIEMVEALQALSAFSQIRDGLPVFEDYRKKSMQFITASLAREVLDNGEIISIGSDLRSHHEQVEERGKFFEDMPLTTALNLRFFLTRLVSTWNVTPYTAQP